MFAGVSAQEVWSAWDRDILVTGRQQSFPTAAHEVTSSDDETSNFQKEVFVNSQKTQPADIVPCDTDHERFNSPERQESSSSVEGGKCEEMVLSAPLNFCDNGLQMQLRPTLQMQKLLGEVFNPKELIDTYLRFRQLLGNNVQESHEAWETFKATNGHPLLKVAALAFGVISTPETSSYMEQQWDQLQEHVGQNRPDAIMARAMMDYARAWAYRREEFKKARKIVKAFYKKMKDGDSTNFFLAPCYTVTIGRWTYEANNHHLSYQVIEKVEGYAYKTLRQLKSLEDEWAIIDTFGMKLNATLLLLWVKKYYTDTSLSVENLEQDIENLLGELERFLSHPKITTYDEAGFYSVRKLNFENVDREEFCRCAKKSAKLFRDNGRIQRALEEAELSGDTELVQEISQEAQNIPE